MKRTYRHVFFDFDGVLCDSLAACSEEYDRLRSRSFKQLPVLLEGERMDVPFSGPLRSSLHRWLAPEDARSFFEAHSAAMATRASTLRPFPGVLTELNRLPEDSVTIVSSAYNSAIATVLEGGSQFLPPSVYTLKGRDSREPKTLKISAVLTELSLPNTAGLYVGDLISDLEYCRAVPIDCLLVSYGYNTTTHLKENGADAVGIAHSVKELFAFLREHVESDGRPISASA